MERLVPLAEVVQPTQQRLPQRRMEQPRLTWPQERLQMLLDIPMQQQHSLTGPMMVRYHCFHQISLASNNSTVSITLNEAVYNTNGGPGSLEASDFGFTISGGSATLGSSTPSSISASSNTYTLGISLSERRMEQSILNVYPTDNGIFDIVNNEVAINQTFNTILLNDVSGPTMAITGKNGGGTSVADGASTSDNPLTMTFTMSEPTSDFVVGDITVSGGSLSSFSTTTTSTDQLGSDIDSEAAGDTFGGGSMEPRQDMTSRREL